MLAGLQAALKQSEAVLHLSLQAIVQFIQSLAALFKVLARGAKPLAQMAQALLRGAELLRHDPSQPPMQAGQSLADHRQVRAHQFRSGGRGRSAQIGGKIGQPGVHLMAHGRDNGNGALGNRPGQGFVVEGPQIFQRPAAPADNQDVTFVACHSQPQRLAQLYRRIGTLHRCRINHHGNGRAAALQYLQDIANGSAAGGGDHPNLAGPGRQCLFAVLGEQPFALKLGLERVELGLESPLAGGLHVFDHNLEVATGHIQGDFGPHQHLLAILGGKIQQPVAISKHGPINLGTRVFQAEVPVTGGGAGKVGQFAL